MKSMYTPIFYLLIAISISTIPVAHSFEIVSPFSTANQDTCDTVMTSDISGTSI